MRLYSRSVTVAAAAGLLAAAAACAGVRHLGAPPLPCVDPALHARAAAGDSAVTVPVPVELFLPPRPAPPGAAARPIRLAYRVDSVGRLDTASVAVTGTDDAAYRARLRALVQRMQFRPAQLGGCAVSGWGHVEYVIGS